MTKAILAVLFLALLLFAPLVFAGYQTWEQHTLKRSREYVDAIHEHNRLREMERNWQVIGAGVNGWVYIEGAWCDTMRIGISTIDSMTPVPRTAYTVTGTWKQP